MLSVSGRNRLLGVTMLAITFAVGGLAGAALTRVVEAQQAEARPVAGSEDGACETKKTSILDQLGLSAEQRSRIDEILAERRIQTEAFWDSAGPTLQGIMAETRQEVRAVLDTSQRAEYDRIREERRAKREREDNSRVEADDSAR